MFFPIKKYKILQVNMSDFRLKQIEKEILKFKTELQNLEPMIGENEALSSTYNQILIKKAVLIEEYKKEFLGAKNQITKNKHRFFLKTRKKYICDYFQ